MCWSLEQGSKSSAASLCIERAENELRKQQDPPITEPASNPSIIMGPSSSLNTYLTPPFQVVHDNIIWNSIVVSLLLWCSGVETYLQVKLHNNSNSLTIKSFYIIHRVQRVA